MANKLIILGASESGVGAAILAQRSGYDVLVSDNGTITEPYMKELHAHGIAYEQGGHSLDMVVKADAIVKSPGIPEKTAVMQAIRKAGLPVMSEIELAYQHKGDARVVAITGTNGKTTTTALTHHVFVTGGADAALVGNIGYSFARQVALDPKPYYIVEVSSFQLDDIAHFRADVAVLLNITEDHLDRYNYRMEEYIASKFNIVRNATRSDAFVYNMDDPIINQYIAQNFISKTNLLPISMKQEVRQGAYIKDEEMLMKIKEEEFKMSIHDFALKGKHNSYNTMAAGVAASVLDIRNDKIREAVQTFSSLPHRMQPVATVKGVEYINDSKSTNINSLWFALESMTKPVVLIMGGVDKGNDYTLIEELVQDRVKAIVCLGTDNARIHEALKDKVPAMYDAQSAEEAVKMAYNISAKDDVVLLSPACASFDLFRNYEDRGNQFINAVRSL